jgi:hypothetical protein
MDLPEGGLFDYNSVIAGMGNKMGTISDENEAKVRSWKAARKFSSESQASYLIKLGLIIYPVPVEPRRGRK